MGTATARPPSARPAAGATLILLPGIDGTDVYFRPLIASLPAPVRPLVVCLPTSGASRYADLLPLVREAVAGLEAFYVLGWSFSGPLALMLAAAEPGRTRGVILAASFVRPPRPVLGLVGRAATAPVLWAWRVARRLPGWITRPRTDPVRRDKAETWARVPARIMAARVRAIASVDARDVLRRCAPPVLHIASSHDEAVPPRNVAEVVGVRPTVGVRTIEGPHLALYTNPQAAVGAILEFLDAHGGAGVAGA